MPTAVNHNFVSQLCGSDLCYAEHEGPLGIKCCFSGHEIYEIEGGRTMVDASTYLVLNRGQRYASALHGAQTAESFCVWFRPGFAEQALRSLRTPADRLLDDPLRAAGQSVLFFEQTHPHDALVSPVLFRIYRAVNAGHCSPPWLEEQFHLLLERLLQAHHNIYSMVARLPAIRPVTRVELYRRLARARDYLDASLERSVSLSEMAEVACLSPHHFLRQFVHLYAETPHQYHRRRRLERARHLVISTQRPVTEICFGLGFESLGHFSGLFHRQFGCSPTQFRARHAKHPGIHAPGPGSPAPEHALTTSL
jgi:AraC-like DNA-binding protein